jgi:polar amino acid transport system substrate-binding protein
MNSAMKTSVAKWIATSIVLAVLSTVGNTYGGENPLCRMKTLTVGIAKGDFPPFIITGKSERIRRTTGLDIDIINTLVKSCPVGSQPVVEWEAAPFNELFDRLRDGQYDLVISSISINVPDPERNGLAYSHPYYDQSGLVLAVKKGSKAQKELAEKGVEALSRNPIYVQRGTNAHDYVKKMYGEGHVRTPQNSEEGLKAVLDLAADSAGELILYDWAHLHYLLEVQQVYQEWEIFKLKGNPYFFTHEQYGIVVSAKETALLSAINEKIDQNREQINTLVESWFRRLELVELTSKLEEGSVIYEAPSFIMHSEDLLSRLTLKLGGGISYKQVETQAISGSIEFPIGVYKVWASPELREFFFGFYRDFEWTFFDPSANLTHTSSKGDKSQIISDLWSINPITTKYTFGFSSAKISVNLIFLGYTGQRKEEKVLNDSGQSQGKVTQTIRATYTTQLELKVPLVNNVGLSFSIQRIFPWSDISLKQPFRTVEPLESSYNLALTITPFAKQ